MKKSTKGSLAAGAAAVLLLGGAGSLAFWSDSDTIAVSDFSTGTLNLTGGTCDTGWVYAGTTTAVNEIVPGDSITKDCDFTVEAKGDNLSATLSVPSTVAITGPSAPTSFSASAAVTSTLGSTITENNDGDTLTATVTVTFPRGDASTINANDTKNVTASLANLVVTLEQD